MQQTKNIYLRLVNENDIDLILDLRLNKNLNQYLGYVESDKKQQLDWLKKYKEREAHGTDYYFVVVDKVLGDIGLVRVYDVDHANRSFTWGSWVLREDNRPKYAALDSVLLSYEFAFIELGLNLCRFKVHTENTRAKHFYERFGGQIVGQDDYETLFELTKSQYLQLKYSRYYQFLLN